jgi:hypothetical protein
LIGNIDILGGSKIQFVVPNHLNFIKYE